jgi:N-acyl-D-amino-acid deacylase
MMDTIESQGCLLNAAVLAPHGILRIDTMGDSDVPAAAADIDGMTRLLHECFDAGAIGMSTGLQYFPGLCSDTGELVRLAKVVHDRDGVFTSHLRSYNQSTMDRALDEVMEISRRAEVPVQVSHLFIVPELPFRLFEVAKIGLRAASRLYAHRPFSAPLGGILQSFVERATRHADAGLPLGFDAMPTSAAFTHLLAFLPPWAMRGGLGQVIERLKDRPTRARIRHSIEHGETRWPHRGPDAWSLNLLRLLGYDCVVVMSVKSAANQGLIGKSLAQIARERGCHPFDAACDLLIEEQGRVLTFETATHPGDDFAEMAQEDTYLDPHVSIVTDTILLGFGMPSHLFYDCYPRFLGRYARDRKLLSLPEAIRKCTSLPAAQLRIRDRGTVKQGLFADLVVFDPATIGSRSTPLEPAQFPDGIRWVLINGKPVVEPERVNLDAKAGRLLRKGA